MKSGILKLQNVLEIVFWGVLLLLTNLTGLEYPMLFFGLTILSIVPVTVITVKYKETIALIVSLLVLTVLLFKFSVVIALIKFLAYSLVGMCIGYCLRHRFSLKKSIVLGGVAHIVAFILSNVITSNFLGINIIQDLYVNKALEFLNMMKIDINSNLNDFINNLSNYDINNLLQLQMQQAWWLTLFWLELIVLVTLIGSSKLNLIFLIIPGFIILAALIGSYVIIVLSQLLTRNKENNMEPFSEFKLPMEFGVVFIIIQLLLWGSNIQQGTISNWGVILLNMTLILNFGFMVQGIALVDFWLKKAGLKGVIRMVMYATLSIFLIPFCMIFIILGILDYLMDFRKLETR